MQKTSIDPLDEWPWLSSERLLYDGVLTVGETSFLARTTVSCVD